MNKKFRITIDGQCMMTAANDNVVKQVIFEALKETGFNAGNIRVIRINE